MREIDLTCIGCPMGCAIKVHMNGQEVVRVSGNTCRHGEAYAKKEVTNPTRVVTTTVPIRGSKKMLPVKTRQDIPKNKIFDCIRALRQVKVSLPIQTGDVVLENVAGTGVDVVATKTIG